MSTENIAKENTTEENPANKGYVQVYTGNGKGKTTAALGLTLRAVGRNKKIYIGQFMKKSPYGEIIALEKYFKDHVTLEQFGLPDFHYSRKGITPEEQEAALAGIESVKKAIASGKYDIVILDEANMVAHFKIIDMQPLLDIIDTKPENMELILTGRYAPQEFIDRAHLVTEMKEIKHYYTQKVPAREGIEM